MRDLLLSMTWELQWNGKSWKVIRATLLASHLTPREICLPVIQPSTALFSYGRWAALVSSRQLLAALARAPTRLHCQLWKLEIRMPAETWPMMPTLPRCRITLGLTIWCKTSLTRRHLCSHHQARGWTAATSSSSAPKTRRSTSREKMATLRKLNLSSDQPK